MNLFRLIILLFILNLFFIGLMVGITFAKQNPAAEFWGIISDSSSNYSGLTTMDRFKVFFNRLQKAGNYTVCSIYRRWNLVVNNFRMRIAHTNITSFILEHYKRVVMDKPKVATLNAKTPARESGDNLDLEPTILKQSVNNETILKVSPSSTSGGRSDPFLLLEKQFQVEAKPKVKKELKIIKQPKVAAKEIVEPKLPIESKVAEFPKPDKPGAKILNDYHLRGVVIGDVPIAYVEDRNGYHKLRIGDFLAEGKIIDITETSLSFQIAGEQVVMRMEGLK